MAVFAKDGSRHHSAGRASLHDSMASKSAAPPEKAAAPAVMAPPGAEAGNHDVSSRDISDVVKEHGPAHSIVMHHDHENGVHTVTSHHGKHGHMHHSEHKSAAEAHDHARMAAGHDEGEETPEEEAAETPEEEAAENETPQEAGAHLSGHPGGRIPGLAS
jgi:hypothetical protein